MRPGDLRFGPVCLIGFARTASLAAVSILLAARGFGAMSLAWGTVTAEVVALGLAVGAVGRAGRTAPRLRGWGGVARFGAMRTAVGGLTQAGDAGTMLVTSHLLGFAATGLLARGQRISSLFDEVVTQAVRPVVLPALVHHGRGGGDLKAAYLFKLACISGLAWPFFGFTALFAEPIVVLLLGPMWSDVVPIVRILCLVGACSPATNLNPRFYAALDMLPLLLRRQVLLQPAKLVLITAAALVSVELVAAALVGAQLLKAALTVGPLKRRLGYGRGEALRSIAASALVTGACLLPVIGLLGVLGMPAADDIGFLCAAAGTAALGWLAGVLGARHPLAHELSQALSATEVRLRSATATTASAWVGRRRVRPPAPASPDRATQR